MRSSLRNGSLLFVLLTIILSAASFAQFAVIVSFAPPALPIYEQPLCPGDGYLWTPGYWAYDPDFGDYFWVPGTWVLAPQVGYLWTPPWWGWNGNGFLYHEGYWGRQVGFYGGIPYGYGYFGHGYEGGRWDNDRFYYNRAVNNINVTEIHNVYNTTVVQNNTYNRVSYNGGEGGIPARPTSEEEAAGRERHVAPVPVQMQHAQAAASNPQLRAAENHGRPPIAATARPGGLNGSGAVPAKAAGAAYTPPPNRAAASNRSPVSTERGTAPENAAAGRPETNVPQPPPPTHAKDLPPHPQPPPSNSENAETNRKYQQQQQQLYNQQQQEHQKLAQQQEQEHQRAAQQQANAARMQQMEQQHQQQTQQIEQQHAQQQQQMNTRQAPPPPSHKAPQPPPEKL
jgi:hypothetical protein